MAMTVAELTSVSMSPNPVRTGEAFVIRVRIDTRELTWRQVLAKKWSDMKLRIWG